MMTFSRPFALTVSALAVASLAACTQAQEVPEVVEDMPAAEETETPAIVLDSPSIVATTSILGNVAEQIATCVAEREGAVSEHVRTLMPIGTDPHDFQPSSGQVATMMSADIVIGNGLGLEESLLTVFEQLQEEGANLELVAEWIEPLEFAGDDHHDHDHGHGDEDPHFWLDMNRVALVATELGQRLSDSTGDTAWAECGADVAGSISDAEVEVIATFDQIDPDNRVIVTDHDAFAYLADRYDFDIAGVVIPGGSTLGEATSQDLARLVANIENQGVKALIGSFHRSNPLLDAVAEESGGSLQVVPIYVESIGEPGSPAATYQGMMIWNAQQITQALQD